MQICGNTFIVSGGVSGLGLATVEMLLSAKANILVLDRNEELGQALQQKYSDQIIFAATDILDSSKIEKALKNLEKRFDNIVGIINCAGIAPAQKVLSRDLLPMPLEDFQKVLDINVSGTLNLIRLATPYIIRNKKESAQKGIIINTASVAAFEGQIGQVAYAASKSAIVGMTLPLAREFARHLVRVMAIAPGIFETPMLKGLPQKAQESLAQQVPHPARLGQAHEYANLCRHIIENDYLNGEVIRLDGAIRMGAN